MADPLSHLLPGITSDAIRHQGEIIVVGLGRFGSALATTLIDLDIEVLAIDEDADRVERHAERLTHVVQGDATSERTLRQLGAADAVTAVVCIGNDVESSILCTSALVDIGVPNVWAKAITAPHGKILTRVGARQVVFPEAQMGVRVAHMVTGSMYEYLALDENFVIVETRVPGSLDGKTLGEASLRAAYRVTVVCLKPRGGAFTYAEADSLLHRGDLIVVAGDRPDVERFAKLTADER